MVDNTFSELRNKCEILWQELQNKNQDSDESQIQVNNAPKTNTLSNLLHHKEKQLKSQLEIMGRQDFGVVSEDLDLIETLQKNSSINNKDNLEETLLVLKKQREAVATECQMERKILERQEEIQAILRSKINKNNNNDHVVDMEKKIINLKKQKKVAEKLYNTSMKHLAAVVLKYFNKTHETTYHSDLLSLLEMMMNCLFEMPHNPYIEMKNHWTPYIELLLRCNIIQRHPNDCNLIRLVAFHQFAKTKSKHTHNN